MEINDISMQKNVKLPISVIILTYNEEKNIEECLKSVYGWVEEIFIVDSYSTDKTLEIARKYTDKIYQHPFENYSAQRNWALNNLSIKTDWVMNLDADHRITSELKRELIKIFTEGIDSSINGVIIKRKTIFLGKWIRWQDNSFHQPIFRKGKGLCEDRLYDQHFVVDGKKIVINEAIIDIISDNITRFIERHNKWATLEAIEQLRDSNSGEVISAKFFGTKIERRRFLRAVYNKFPLFIRPVLLFIYRYFFRLGFLDGKEGLIWHLLQGFWYRFLVDAKIYEIEKRAKKENKDVKEVIRELYGIEI
jgi:glycosyltransferase involved in cell wall biosynthesis